MGKIKIRRGHNYNSPNNRIIHRNMRDEWVLYPDGTGVRRAIKHPTLIVLTFPNEEALQRNIDIAIRYAANNHTI